MAVKKNDGEIVYVIRGDDGNLEHDLDEAQKKVEKSLEDNADKAVDIEKKKNDEIVRDTEKSVKEINSAIDSVEDITVDANISDAQIKINGLQAKDIQVGIGAETSEAESKINSISEDKTIDIHAKANISDAESKLKSVSDDRHIKIKTDADVKDAEVAIKGLEDTAEDTAGNIQKLISNAFGAAKGGAIDALSSASPLAGTAASLASGLGGTAVAAIGAGAAAAGVGAMAVSKVNEIDQAIDQLISSTDLSKEKANEYQEALENIYKNNFGENFADIAESMSLVNQVTGEIDPSNLEKMTTKAIAMRDIFGIDMGEGIRGVNNLVYQFGLDTDKAFDLIAAGAKKGLNFTDELGDNVAEYGGNFAQAGYSAEEYFQLLENGTDNGAYNLDKVNDAINEVKNKLADGSVEDNLSLYSEKTQGIFKDWQDGQATMKDVIDSIVADITNCTNEQDKLTMASSAFGSLGEDSNLKFIESLTSVGNTFDEVGGKMDEAAGDKASNLSASWDTLKRNLEMLLVPLGEALLPIVQELISALSPVVTGVILPIIEAISSVISLLAGLLVPQLQIVLSVFTEVFSGIVGTVTSVIEKVIDILKNLTGFIVNILTGDWKSAWENIVNIFSDIVGGLGEILKAPINFCIDIINGFIHGLNKIKIPDWVPKLGGKGINIPDIPRLKVGLDYVPSDFYPAFLDEGEAVLTKQENAMYRQLGGVYGMYALNNTNSGNVPEIDYNRLGQVMKRAFDKSGNTAAAPDYIALYIDGQEFIRWLQDENGNYRNRTGTGLFG